MQTAPPSKSSLAELASLAELCDEGRRHFLVAAQTAEDIPTRAICLHTSRHCQVMTEELSARIRERGGRWEPRGGAGDVRSPQKTQMVRCLNWRAGASLRYELALRRPSLPEEDRLLLSLHHHWLQDTERHLTPLANLHLAAA